MKSINDFLPLFSHRRVSCFAIVYSHSISFSVQNFLSSLWKWSSSFSYSCYIKCIFLGWKKKTLPSSQKRKNNRTNLPNVQMDAHIEGPNGGNFFSSLKSLINTSLKKKKNSVILEIHWITSFVKKMLISWKLVFMFNIKNIILCLLV